MTDTPRLDFWFDFASTYSYPAAMRIGALAHASGIAVRWRPFLLGPIFKAQGWDSSPFNLYPAKGRYMWRDLERLCVALDLPLVRPDVFPQNSLLAARVGLIADAEGWVEDFSRAVYRAEFGQGHDIGTPESIAGVLKLLGKEPDTVIARAQTDANKSALRRQSDEAQQLGIFGAPSFVAADGELFWGNDRLEAAIGWAATARAG